MEQSMWAKCLNSHGTNNLEKEKEYHVVKVVTHEGFGDSCFYVLEDGLAYASCHFTVTYLLNRKMS